MQLDRLVPYLLVDDPIAANRFYVDHVGFEPTTQLDWFVSLVHRDRPEYMLDFRRRDHEVVPEAFRGRRSSLMLAFVVPDATSEYARLRAAGLAILYPLRDEPWGQRRFIGVAPTDVIIEILEVFGPPKPKSLA